MADKIPVLKEKKIQCRIKVNKMLSSISSYRNIFIPTYTLTNRNEEKYLSNLNKKKRSSVKSTHSKKKNIKNLNIKNNYNKGSIITTEENYKNQPIDFIINHGVIVYQRSLDGDEIINFGLNNEYLKKKNFNMVKKDNSIYQTESNSIQNDNSNLTFMSHIDNTSHRKHLRIISSREKLLSMSDIPLLKNKSLFSRQNKIFNTNINTFQNSLSTLNSISVKNCLLNSKINDLSNKTRHIFNCKMKNSKKIINYLPKNKNKANKNSNPNILLKNKKNFTLLKENDEIQELNNTYALRNIKDNKIISKYFDNKYHTIYINEIIMKSDKKSNNMNKKKLNDKIKINPEKKLQFEKKIIFMLEKLNICTKFYLKKYFYLFRYNIYKNIIDNKIKIEEKENKIRNNINNKNKNKANKQENLINKININEAIMKKNKLIERIQNSFEISENKKSNSIIVNRKMSSNTSIEYRKSNDKHYNLSSLISKNLRFFSKENENNNDTRESEMFRDSASLQKKYEQICRRKKRDLSLTFSTKIKDFNYINENNYFSDFNSFSNYNDNNSTNSLKMGLNKKKFNQIFYKDSCPKSNENKIINNNNKGINLKENQKAKYLYKIKLIKGKNKDKKIISYRIEKSLKKISNDISKIKNSNNTNNNTQISSEIKNIKLKNNNYNYNYNKDLLKINTFNINNNKISNNNIEENNNSSYNKLNNKKIFNQDKKNNLVEEKNKLKTKNIYFKKGINKDKNISDNSKNKKKYNKYIVKNICTNDKRIFLYIAYIPLFSEKKNINYNNYYNNKLLKIKNVINYKYLGKNQKIKNANKKNNDYEKKLSLIKEEDEKSKFLNSTNSVRLMDEYELNSHKNNFNNIRIIKDNGYIFNISKVKNLLMKYYYNKCFRYKNEFIFKLKMIYIISVVKKIINSKLKDSQFIKYIQMWKKKQKNMMIYYPKRMVNKNLKGLPQVSNIFFKDKIYFNNIIINNKNILTSHSFDFNKEFKIFESPIIRRNVYYRKNIDEYNKIPHFVSKTEKKKIYKDI